MASGQTGLEGTGWPEGGAGVGGQLSLGARPCGGWACADGLEATLRDV